MIKVIKHTDTHLFETAVNVYLKEGWQIHSLCTSLETLNDAFVPVHVAYMERN